MLKAMAAVVVVLGIVVGCSSADEATGQSTSGSCDPGGTCECKGDGNCDKTCTGSGCALTCTGNGGCSLACPKGGCTVTCAGGGGCKVTSCTNCTCTATGQGGCL